MASVIDKFQETVERLGNRMATVEKTVTGLAKGQTDASDIIKKALLDPRGRADAAVGWDGGDAMSLIRRSGGKNKTVGGGFNEFLLGVAQGAIGVPGVSNFESHQRIMKSYGVRPVNKAANAEGSGATGGFLVPPQFSTQLLKIAAEASFFRAMCNTQPMAGREFNFPYLNQSATTASSASNYPSSNFYGGVFASWTPEAATYPQSNPVFKMGKLTAYDLVMLCVVSNQLLNDNAYGLESLLTTLFADSLGWQLDYAFLRGSGVNQPLGILNAPGTIAAARTGGGSTFTLASASTMLSSVVASSWDNLVWVMHQSVLPQLIQMTNGATNSPFLVWMNPAFGDNTNEGPAARRWPMKFFGIPIYFTEKTPKLGTAGDVMLLDASKYLVGDRQAIQIEASPAPYFTSNQMVWRVIWRGDGQPQFDSAITLADGAGTFTVSPHVILAA